MSPENKRYDLHASIGYQATLSARVYERRLEERLRKLGLTRLGWCILLAVGEEKLASPSDIAAFIGIDRTATSRALKGLEADGLLTRSESRGDRRRTEVHLTPDGTRLLGEAIAVAQANAAHFRAKLSDEERDHLARLMAKMRAGEDTALSNF
ncbi:MarR family transcriptional regulator [Litoreibacter ponti]|uniref:MarR family transcriptional regulator n=1 Tax=Litoreibacter ponti TaxID=1510457 RepID=A0A2T6BE23_9RHOB|nr:MarR family transcriptional regulator [Litoreibacter ponti]PTX54309.1 MarR family transcriptional regulator [Litoreibacter ponti]